MNHAEKDTFISRGNQRAASPRPTFVLVPAMNHTLRYAERERGLFIFIPHANVPHVALCLPTRCPVLFLTHVAAVPGGLALRANFEVIQMAQNLAPVVEAMLIPLQRAYAEHIELVNWIMRPHSQPMRHAGQDIRGDVVTVVDDPSRRGGLTSLSATRPRRPW